MSLRLWIFSERRLRGVTLGGALCSRLLGRLESSEDSDQLLDVALLRELRERVVALYALSNWGADEFEAMRDRFPLLDCFSGVLISGRVGLCKPDPKFFELLVREHRLNPATVAFIDDQRPNVVAAQQLGFRSFLFRSAADLREKLSRGGLL